MVQKLIKDNTTNISRRTSTERLHYPFLLIKLGQDACFTIKEDETNSRVCIFSEKPFTIIRDEDVMKGFLKNDDRMKSNLKLNLSPEVFQYINKFQLFEQYFSSYTDYSSANFNIIQNDVNNCSPTKKHSFSSMNSDRDRRLSFGTAYERSIAKSFDKIEEDQKVEEPPVQPKPIIIDN